MILEKPSFLTKRAGAIKKKFKKIEEAKHHKVSKEAEIASLLSEMAQKKALGKGIFKDDVCVMTSFWLPGVILEYSSHSIITHVQ